MPATTEAIKRLIFGADALAVARSLRDQPHAWAAPSDFRLRHRSGCELWIGNRAYGMSITPPGKEWRCGVTLLSSLGLSPKHHLLRRAADRWLAANAPAKPSLAEILAVSQ